MDAKDLRIEPAPSERSSDASKYAQSGTALQCNRNKSYQDIGSAPSNKVDAPPSRPCAVIGPDRVVPPPEPNDAFVKKAQIEPWPCSEPVYHRPPEYPHKTVAYHNPTRNISPRQTFQENMQRIMVPPIYNSVKINEEAGFIQKFNVTSDAKYCEVPYSVNLTASDQKNIRSAEMCLPNVNSALGRPPHGWAPSGINVRPQRPYVSSEMYQHPEYPSCAGPRPVSISRPHRTIPEESGYMYPEHCYQEPNIRFKPYPNVKERFPQPRYDYVTNYSNPFHPPPPQKTLPPHPYSGYPHFKYIDSRIPETLLEGYQRPIGQQGGYNIAYRNQIVHPAYGNVITNNSQSKMPPFPPDGSYKPVTSNKLPYDNNGKLYVEYENTRTKQLPSAESFYSNDLSKHHTVPKGTMPNYPSINMHALPPHSYYKKENPQMKNYDYVHHYKNLNPSINLNSPMQRLMPQCSPNAIAISPSDSHASNDTLQIHGTQEDCGYLSHSTAPNVRSIELGNSRIPYDCYGRYYDPRYGAVIRTAPPLPKTNKNNISGNTDTKDKKDMDVRKFLQMWNEGDDDYENVPNKEIVIQNNSNEPSPNLKLHASLNNQEQLYVLGLVNVSNEDLSKYEHIQKVSKLPENIKGYNSIELLNQFEEVIESSNMDGFKLSNSKELQVPVKQFTPKQSIAMIPRPISPLDVEAKISQSVIHKEVGCNFEIKPCSPKMLNVEVASPVQNILNERVIEKVANPLSMITPILNGIDSIEHCKISDSRQDHRMLEDSDEISSCKMINTPFSNTNTHSIKTNYSIQDLESNAGVCLASLPRLDNDIELNFPEVNQQFINANKGEPVMAKQIKDLPELSELNEASKIINNIKPENSDNRVLSPKVETEREFTKLSKYRKMKTNASDVRPDQSGLNAFRTDSVIIKNPENSKTLDIDKEQYSPNKLKQMDQHICTDLISQVEFEGDDITETDVLSETKSEVIAHKSPDTAIDFRLHKDADENFELNHDSPKIYKSTQSSKEVLSNKSILHEEEDNEMRKYPEIKEMMISQETNCDTTFIKNNTENNTDQNIIPLNVRSVAASCETESLTAPDIINELNLSSDLKYSLSNIANSYSHNVSEKEILELKPPIGNIDKTIVGTCNTSETKNLGEAHVDGHISSPIDINIREENPQDVTCDVSYEKCKVIKPTENLETLNIIEVSESEIPLSKDATMEEVSEHILEDDSTDLSDSTKTQLQQKYTADCRDIVDKVHNINDELLTHKENLLLQKENVKSCNSEQQNETTDMSYLDKGFCSIDEKQNCDTVTISYYDDNDTSCKNYTNVETYNEMNEYVSKYSGYGSKALYSPWIQNLIMFDEGVCSAKSCNDNRTLPMEIENLAAISRLDDINSAITSENVIDSGTEISENICNNTNSDSTLQFEDNLEIKTNTLMSPTHSVELNIKIKKYENVGTVDKLLQNIQNDEDVSDKEKDSKDQTVTEVLFCDGGENTSNITISATEVYTKDKNALANDELGIEIQSIATNEEHTIGNIENRIKVTPTLSTLKQRKSFKRSLSDSALNNLHNESKTEREELSVVWPVKRSKLVDSENESEILAQNLCNILQHNRRNSISAVYSEDVSFCILIEDNSAINEENEDAEKICYTELSEDCINEINNAYRHVENNVNIPSESVSCDEETDCDYSNTITLNGDHDIALDGTWVEDVACVETVVSDDIEEDIVNNSAPNTEERNFWYDDLTSNINSDKEDEVLVDSPKYHDELIHSDREILKLCETPQIDVDKTLIPRQSERNDIFMGLYDNESLEKILSESNSKDGLLYDTEYTIPSHSPKRSITPDNKENMNVNLAKSSTKENCSNALIEVDTKIIKSYDLMQDVTVHSCESSIDDVFSYNHKDEKTNYTTSSSPEVSSTTPEEKSSGLLLKITNYKGTKVSQLNSFHVNDNNNKISCKFTEKTDYVVNSNAKLNSNRPLITKAAQKYIPPIKESINDLKVKLSLPQHSLLKLKQIKSSKDVPKLNKQANVLSRLPKKPKPKFEDVLKSIDEIQIKMHKEKTKKVKKSIPKVVIKKNENGSHYASTSNNDTFNPDLTGRKWQPWVFLEKNNFIDKMATRRKTKAIFSYRKNSYVLAEKFHKYKSVSSTKFVITQPKLTDSSSGQLKYTIRLKHSY